MKNLAATQGPKVRVNAVLPGLLLTEWGQKFGTEVIESLKSAAALKDATNLEDCADAFIMLAKNGSMTGMKVQVGESAANLPSSRPTATSKQTPRRTLTDDWC